MNCVVLRNLAAVLASLTLASCATGPQHRSYTDTTGLTIGKTTPDECREIFGQPKDTWDDTSGDGAFEIRRYVQLEEHDAKAFTRSLFVEFKDGVLNGYYSGSSFRKDRSTFSITNVGKIKWATSTKDDVRLLLGDPQGVIRCPTRLLKGADCKSTGRETWIYQDLQATPLFGLHIKRIFNGVTCQIVFDATHRVIDIVQTGAY